MHFSFSKKNARVSCQQKNLLQKNEHTKKKRKEEEEQ